MTTEQKSNRSHLKQSLFITISGVVFAANSGYGFFLSSQKNEALVLSAMTLGFVLGSIMAVYGCVRLLVYLIIKIVG